MPIRFVGQPVDSQIGSAIVELLARPSVTRVRFLVAWAKRSGLARLRRPLTAARDRGVFVEAVVGVDEGGATVQGLEELRDLTDSALVFHNPKSPKRTFHPKIYLFDGSGDQVAIVGSGNLTRGGLFGNYEAATIVDVDPSQRQEVDYFIAAENYYRALSEDAALSKVLDEEFFDALKAHPSMRIGDERRARSRGTERTGAPGDSLFGASAIPILGIPVLLDAGGPSAATSTDDDDDDDVIAIAEVEAEIAETESEADAGMVTDGRGFYKRLGKNDVSLTGSPGQIIIPIRFLDFFGELKPQDDRLRTTGAQQLGRDDIPTVYHDGTTTRDLSTRVIQYVPAPDHPRQNTEVRFTFRDRPTLESLNEGDYLDFEWEDGVLHVYRSQGARPERFDWR